MNRWKPEPEKWGFSTATAPKPPRWTEKIGTGKNFVLPRLGNLAKKIWRNIGNFQNKKRSIFFRRCFRIASRDMVLFYRNSLEFSLYVHWGRYTTSSLESSFLVKNVNITWPRYQITKLRLPKESVATNLELSKYDYSY